MNRQSRSTLTRPGGALLPETSTYCPLTSPAVGRRLAGTRQSFTGAACVCAGGGGGACCCGGEGGGGGGSTFGSCARVVAQAASASAARAAFMARKANASPGDLAGGEHGWWLLPQCQ